jgi:PilZ domain
MTEDARPSRRQHPRYNVDVQVEVSVAGGKLDARTRDMSRAGLCLVTTQPIARETEVSLQLVLTFGEDGVSEPLEIDGRVAWCTALFGAYQVGVKFVKVDDDRAKYLNMFVGFLDGTLAPGGMLTDADDLGTPLQPNADPDDPFAY